MKPASAEMAQVQALFSLAKQSLERIYLLSINWFGLNIGEEQNYLGWRGVLAQEEVVQIGFEYI